MNPTIDSPVRLLVTFQQLYPAASPHLVVQAPEREMWAAARYNGSAHYAVYSADTRRRTSFDYQSAKRKQTLHHRPLPRWARYIAGVCLKLDVLEMPGLDVVICGDEPAGPRYDHALAILFAALWYEVNMCDCTPEAVFEVAEQVRREYIEGQR